MVCQVCHLPDSRDVWRSHHLGTVGQGMEPEDEELPQLYGGLRREVNNYYSRIQTDVITVKHSVTLAAYFYGICHDRTTRV